MTQDIDKPKPLSLKKPLSLTKEAEIATLFRTQEEAKEKLETSKSFNPSLKASKLAKGKDQRQISHKLGLDDIKHKAKKQTSEGLTIEKDRGTNKDKGQTQVPVKLSKQEEKMARRKVEEQRQKRMQEALIWLMDTFPACFKLDTPQPLKIGIFDDIIQIVETKDPTDVPTRGSLRKAIKYYIQNRLYYAAMLTSSHRYDLEGNMAQEVTDQEREYAKIRLDLLEARYKKWQEKNTES